MMSRKKADGRMSLDHVHETAKRMVGNYEGMLIAMGASGVVLGYWNVYSTSLYDVEQQLKELNKRQLQLHGQGTAYVTVDNPHTVEALLQRVLPDHSQDGLLLLVSSLQLMPVQPQLLINSLQQVSVPLKQLSSSRQQQTVDRQSQCWIWMMNSQSSCQQTGMRSCCTTGVVMKMIGMQQMIQWQDGRLSKLQ